MYDVYAMMMRELQRFEEADIAHRHHHDRFTPRRRRRRQKRRSPN